MSHHRELNIDELAAIQRHHDGGLSVRAIERLLNRHGSTISRELRRHSSDGVPYDAVAAQRHARSLRRKARVPRKLLNEDLWSAVRHGIAQGWSPRQITLNLRRKTEANGKACVSHETIYKAIYLVPRGALRQDLILNILHSNMHQNLNLIFL